MFRSFYKKNKSTIDRFDGLFLNNTVLTKGFVVAPIIVIANNLINAFIVGSAFAIITFITVILSSIVSKKLPYTIRVIIYVLIACIVFVPTAKMLDNIFPETLFKLGIFLPLLVTNSLIVTKTETIFFKMPAKKMLLSLSCHVLGFFVVIVLVGIIREFLAYGSFMGTSLDLAVGMKVFALPFGGFIVVGFLAAIMQKVTNHIYNKSPKKSIKERG